MLNHNISMVVYQTLRNNAHRAHEAAIGMANIRDNKVRDEQIELSGFAFVFLVFSNRFSRFRYGWWMANVRDNTVRGKHLGFISILVI